MYDAWLLYDILRVVQVEGLGRAQLSKSIFNFTDTQDVRLLVGVDATVQQDGTITHVSWPKERTRS